MRLLIDIGNSRLKWALLDDGTLSSQSAVDYRSEGSLEVLLEQAWRALDRPEAVHMISVADSTVTERVIRWIEHKWACPQEQQETGLHCAGVDNGYVSPQRLGVDRWAAMIAAYGLVHAAICVVDCGTAMTCDAIDCKGKHLGGVIVPGRQMMSHSLIHSTAGITLDVPQASTMSWGTDTASCINAGWIHASVGLIERAVQQLKQQLDEPVILVMTGGDAEFLLPWLSVDYRYEADLVLQGLARMASESVV